jgi:putative nucleotidyltransferase with HDIG domain
LSLHRKVFLVTAAILAVVFAAALSLIDRQVRAVTAGEARRQLAATDRALRGLTAERLHLRNDQVREIALVPDVVAAFEGGDRASLEPLLAWLAPAAARVKVLLAVGPSGGLLAAYGIPDRDRLGAPSLPASLAGVEPFAGALAGQPLAGRAPRGPGRGLWLLDGKIYEMVAAPVRGAGGRPLGALGLGLPIGDQTLARFQSFTQTDLVMLADGRVAGSSLPRRTAAVLAAQAAGLVPGRTAEVEAAGTPYLAWRQQLALDLGSARDLGTSQLMLRPLAGARALSDTILKSTIAVGLVAGALAFLFAWLGVRRITRPLARLSATMSEMAASGELRPDFQSAGGEPEVRRIEESFRRLVVSLEELRRARERSYVEAVGAVVTAADARDHETTGHSFRVARYAVTLARAMGLGGEMLKAIEWGSLLHDVGKMVVPDEILRKTGPLTAAEWHIMRQHPNWGFDMLAEVGFLQQPALEIVYSHHERWDGGGYPRGLAGEEIPLAARIFAVVDTYDAITSDRPYRKAHSHQAAIFELQRVAGQQLDPDIVDAFCRLTEVELRRLRELCKRIHPGLSLPPDLLDSMTEPDTAGALQAAAD